MTVPIASVSGFQMVIEGRKGPFRHGDVCHFPILPGAAAQA